MKSRMITLLVAVGAFLLAALSTGGKIYLLFAILLMVCILTAFFSLLLATRSAKVTHELSAHKVQRGDEVVMEISVSHSGLLPIAPITLTLCAAPGEPPTELRLKTAGRRRQRIAYRFITNHVGLFHPGVIQYKMEDMFGLMQFIREPDTLEVDLMVLPLSFEVEPLTFSPGDTGLETLSKAREDATNPADIRQYQQGDPMKKIHWKLSMRKREIMIRRFEEPDLPDALVLMDCTVPAYLPPASVENPEAYLQDALCETAASIVMRQVRGDNPVRMPLMGQIPVEYDGSMGIPALLEELARLDFSSTEPFERVLLLETRRMRRTGATTIITSRLTSRVVDMIIRIRRMGPYVRVYLITFTPEAPALLPLISKLQHNTIDVCYVTPGA